MVLNFYNRRIIAHIQKVILFESSCFRVTYFATGYKKGIMAQPLKVIESSETQYWKSLPNHDNIMNICSLVAVMFSSSDNIEKLYDDTDMCKLLMLLIDVKRDHRLM